MLTPDNSRVFRILHVEDNPADVRLLREVLRFWEVPHSIHVAQDGAEALDYLAQTGDEPAAPRPDLVLLDLNLPKIHGFDVLAEVKADPKLRSIPILVLSSSASAIDISRAYECRANCYIEKPTEFEEYFRVINTLRHFWFGLAQLPSRP